MNTFITPTWVTKDVALFWKNSLRLLAQFDRQWDESFRNKPEGAQIGYTVQARLPQRFTVSEGQGLQQQPIYNQTIPITINHQYHVDMGWSSADASLEVEEVQKRYTMPAGEALASKWDSQAGLEVYKSIYFAIGTPGVSITDNQTFLDGVALLDNVGVPRPICAVLDPKAQAKLVGANLAIFNLPGGDRMMKTGQFGSDVLGVDDWYKDNLMPTHTTGTFTASTPLVNGANQTGSTLNCDGWASGATTLNQGDIFTIAGVNAVNPISYTDTGILQQFVVTATTSDSSGAMSALPISPSIITSGQLQTVTASPADNAVITVLGATSATSGTLATTTSRQSLIFNEAAFAFVMADLKENLAGARTAMARSKEAQITMRWAEQYNIQTDQNPSRVDTIGGVAVVLPYFALRAYGA